jgi:hypothetical protein
MNFENIKGLISFWIKKEIEHTNKKAILINIEDDSIYSILNYFICKSTNIPVHAIISKTDKYLSWQFCVKNNIPHSIFNQSIKLDQLLINVNFPGMDKISYIESYEKMYELEKTAFISYVAETTNSLYCGNLNRTDISFIRNYPKGNIYDLLPFANFNETELWKIIKHFTLDTSNWATEIGFNTPVSNAELEWAYSVNERTKNYKGFEKGHVGIIDDDLDPTKHPKWFSYTSSQKALIAKLHHQEKLTRCKTLNGKIFNYES